MTLRYRSENPAIGIAPVESVVLCTRLMRWISKTEMGIATQVRVWFGFFLAPGTHRAVFFSDGRRRRKSTLADIDPIQVDPSVKFDSVGGLDRHIESLKEMVVLPLLYPELFQRFRITAPRGVLFFGPPGTGKTLTARALANSCSDNGQKVTFFMLGLHALFSPEPSQ